MRAHDVAGIVRRLGLAMVLSSCGSAQPVVVDAPGPPLPAAPDYARADAWVCRPDLPSDACRRDLDATEFRPDGTRVKVPFKSAANPGADCFYVYPTVDQGLSPGNHTDFADTTRMTEFTRSQVARFGVTCRIFVPLYRQMTIGTYLAPADEHARRFDVAFADVLSAFRYYQAHYDDGRPLVLVGHSQGAQMIEHLLQTVFDGDPAMRARLLVAMPIGGDVEVADGSTAGGTFKNIPLCTSPEEAGCVVAFASYLPEGVKHPWPGPPAAGHHTACVNPADVGGAGKKRLSGAAFPTQSSYRDHMPGSDWAATPFIVVKDFYTAWCVDRPDGFRYLAVSPEPPPGDARKSPIELDSAVWRQQLGRVQLGLHILDMQFTQDDLVSLIERKLAALTRRPQAASTARSDTSR